MRVRWLFLSLIALPGVASADSPNTGEDREVFYINMSVPPLCLLGEVGDEEGQFDMGVLTDRSTGFLRRGLTAPAKRIQGSFCNGPSELNIEAVLMTPEGITGTPRRGFSRGVHFTATASGWTDVPARFRTSETGTQPQATQRRDGPREADILIDVSDFEMNGGPDQRPVASRRYEGAVIVTLAPVP